MGIYDAVKKQNPTFQPDENLQKARNQFISGRKDQVVGSVNANAQSNQDALNRRFASLGASGSGAAISAMQKNTESANDAIRNGMADVNAQEFQLLEGDVGRNLAERDIAFKGALADQDQTNKLAELDLAKKQYELDKDTTAFNKRMAELEAGRTPKGALDGIVDTGMGVAKKIFNPIGVGGGCFLTTACVEVMGMEDNCWVLETARRFRDEYMSGSKERIVQIQEYYELAPLIVEKINARADSRKVWKSLFWKDIAPFVIAVSNDKLIEAHSLYLTLIKNANLLANQEV